MATACATERSKQKQRCKRKRQKEQKNRTRETERERETKEIQTKARKQTVTKETLPGKDYYESGTQPGGGPGYQPPPVQDGGRCRGAAETTLKASAKQNRQYVYDLHLWTHFGSKRNRAGDTKMRFMMKGHPM